MAFNPFLEAVKICKDCGVEKPWSNFGKRTKGSSSGITGTCRECWNRKMIIWSREHPESIKVSVTKNNRKRQGSGKRNKQLQNRRKVDLDYKLTMVLRSRLHCVLRDEVKSGTTLALLGCSIDHFKAWLEFWMKPGMTWENYGLYGWHIDHKKPCASFDLKKPEEQRKCFHYTNLEPLWAEDNLKKGDKVNATR